MSYLVLARRWRPQTFKEIVGQGHITRTLINAIQQNRIAHAYLFVGPRGVGKTSTARILAKALNCEKGPVPVPCQNCISCRDITSGRSLDVLEIDGASNRGIEEIRQLRENIKFSPVHGHFRIYIIDEVHMLTPEAFNALLKTLEEPPLHVKFIFATTAPQRLPATILSRCQRFNFRLISVKEIIRQLKQILREEKLDISDNALYQIACEAQGSMRDAESILDQLVAFGDKKIEEKDVFLLLGRVSKDILFKFIESILSGDFPGVISHFNQIVDKGESPHQLLVDVVSHLRNLLFIKLGKAGEAQLDIIEENLSVLRKHAAMIGEKEIISLIDTLSSASQDMKWSSSPRLVMEVTLIKIVHDIRGRNSEADTHPSSAHTQIKVVSSSKSDGLNLDKIRSRWPQVIEKVKKEKMTAGACLIEGEPVKFHYPVLTISFENEFGFHRETIEKIENKRIVENVLREIFKQDLMIHCTSSEVSLPGDIEKGFQKDPVSSHTAPHQNIIDKVIKLFNGKIVKEGGL